MLEGVISDALKQDDECPMCESCGCDFLLEGIGSLFGYVLYFCYKLLFNNFALALILFTVLTRLLMFPMTINQQKSTAKMQRIQPKVNELQERYKNDKEKLNAEMMALYERENYSPTSGCLPMFIQFPLFMGLYYAIRKPLSCTFHLKNVAEIAAKFLNETELAGYYYEITLIEKIRSLSLDQIAAKLGSNPVLIDEAEKIKDFSDSFNLLGMDLLVTPSFSPLNVNIIIVFLVFIASVGSMLLTNKINKTPKAQAGGCNPNMMGFGMGLFSAWISLGVPSALGFYWIVSSAISPLQSLIVQKFYNANILNSKSEAQRAARLRIDEAEIIEAINLRKGARSFAPIEPTEAETAKSADTSKGKQKQQKKKKGGNSGSSNSSYQGKKKN